MRREHGPGAPLPGGRTCVLVSPTRSDRRCPSVTIRIRTCVLSARRSLLVCCRTYTPGPRSYLLFTQRTDEPTVVTDELREDDRHWCLKHVRNDS